VLTILVRYTYVKKNIKKTTYTQIPRRCHPINHRCRCR